MVDDDINQAFRFKCNEECFVEWWQVDEGRADSKKEVLQGNQNLAITQNQILIFGPQSAHF